MKELIRITVGLTVSCLIAGAVMGAVFVMTAKAKKRNERLHVQETMLSLLGYGKANPAPSGLKFYDIYRYVIDDGHERRTGYMIPQNKGDDIRYALLIIDLEGRFFDLLAIDISPEEAKEADARAAALRVVITPPKTFAYADATIIANVGTQRLAYLLPGEFRGFKTYIRVMLALGPAFQIIGLEIVEQEEDPGLGGEIQRASFKDQFKGKSFENVRGLEVTKAPLPEEYRRYLEGTPDEEGDRLRREDIDEIRNKYQDKDIYALTGATISSEAVTKGVKTMTKKFAYRIETLNHIIAGEGIPTAFQRQRLDAGKDGHRDSPSLKGERDWRLREKRTDSFCLMGS